MICVDSRNVQLKVGKGVWWSIFLQRLLTLKYEEWVHLKYYNINTALGKIIDTNMNKVL